MRTARAVGRLSHGTGVERRVTCAELAFAACCCGGSDLCVAVLALCCCVLCVRCRCALVMGGCARAVSERMARTVTLSRRTTASHHSQRDQCAAHCNNDLRALTALNSLTLSPLCAAQRTPPPLPLPLLRSRS